MTFVTGNVSKFHSLDSLRGLRSLSAPAFLRIPVLNGKKRKRQVKEEKEGWKRETNHPPFEEKEKIDLDVSGPLNDNQHQK